MTIKQNAVLLAKHLFIFYLIKRFSGGLGLKTRLPDNAFAWVKRQSWDLFQTEIADLLK